MDITRDQTRTNYTYWRGMRGRSIFRYYRTFRPGGHIVTFRTALADCRRRRRPERMGCTVFDLITEMRDRYSSNPVDKVAGLVYLLRTPRLQTYTADSTDEEAWVRCCDNLGFIRTRASL
ncbi:hypothetical protein L211DRAFT_6645 [Terfezia boudieri ATCC MYA-4762]|uniref:Uncharacterized protein n=1 Tax=Terfezia boudieri ATCC MYA-4762 TaxID=1051890 RepID=A0A3N4M2T2_9PEZI|nr:hypothetical protein L211DRAFT_6645 [Terfezia boudieri ATCC MYA-4762]